MTRNTLNFVVDTITALAAIAVAVTGLMLAFVLPPAHGRGHDLLWGWTRHDWGDLHLCLGLTVVGLVVVHLALHWTWVCQTCCRVFLRRPTGATALRRNVVGAAIVLVMALFIISFLWVARVSVDQVDRGERGPRRHARQTGDHP